MQRRMMSAQKNETLELTVQGMTCASCVGRVEKVLKKQENIEEVNVNLATEKVIISGQDLDKAQIRSAIERAGYDVVLPKTNRIVLNIEGMTCASCVGRVEKVLKKIAGVENVSVNLATEKAVVEGVTGLKTEDLVKAVERAGYGASYEKNQHTENIIDLNIRGMTCASCVGRVEKALLKVEGVDDVSVNLATESAQVHLQKNISPEILIQTVEKAGYQAEIKNNQSEDKEESLTQRREKEAKVLRRDLIIALICTLPIFVLEMGTHISTSFHHLVLSYLGQSLSWYIQFALTTCVLIFPGRRFYQKGLPALFRLAPDMNSLVALGTLAAYGFSCIATFLPWLLPENTVNVYFEAAAVIVTLILLGRYLEAKAKGKTSQAIERLIGIQPKTARILQADELLEVDIKQVMAGMTVVVQPGEKIAVDGTVLKGHSFVDESMITGEPIAVKKDKDSHVVAGTVNQQGILYIQVSATGNDTVLAQIIRLVEEAQGSKLPIQTMVNQVTMWFVPVVIVLAVITFIAWLVFGPSPAFSFALVNAVAVLIIACPCAMGLATPTSIMVSTGRGAEMGILFRKGEALQTLKEAEVIAFDKTGTLTEGKPKLTDLMTIDNQNKADILRYMASVEQYSEHPVAQAIVNYAKEQQITLLEANEIQVVAGYGIQAFVNQKRICIGADRFMKKLGLEVKTFAVKSEQLAQDGKTPFYIAVENTVAAIVAVADDIKPSTYKAIQSLHELGLKVVMISGDNYKTARAIAKKLKIDDVIAEVLPEGKVNAIQKLQKEYGKVAYVGDGINDAPALASADIGLAVGTGTDVAIESADVVLMSGNLQTVTHAIALSKATIRNIKQNLFWAFIYNIALIPIAAGVLYPFYHILLSPMISALAMGLSSVFVLTNALRLKRFHYSESKGGA